MKRRLTAMLAALSLLAAAMPTMADEVKTQYDEAVEMKAEVPAEEALADEMTVDAAEEAEAAENDAVVMYDESDEPIEETGDEADEEKGTAELSEEIASGYCGYDMTWSLTDDGTLTISGSGEMEYSYLYADPLWGEYEINYVVIEYGVTGICYSAFYDCTSLMEIDIPESVASIGSCAFFGCTNLWNIDIPGSVTSIGYDAFNGCTSIQNIDIPKGVQSIEDSTFRDCISLNSITIPEGVASIGSSAFYGCTELRSITLPESITSIGDYAFYSCTVLESITIPEGVASIGSSAFYGCTGLGSITIPESVTSIGSSAFFGCTGLESITIPEGVASIGSEAFSCCTGLTSIDVADGNINYRSAGGNLFNRDMTKLMQYAAGKTDSTYSIPESVTTICDSAFYGCTGLESITIPEGVASIGIKTFYGCTGLESITIPESVTSIGDSAFSRCTGLESITIPESVTSIERYTFSDCTHLKSITIPNSVNSIGNYAFSGCTLLKNITIPESVTSIERYTFSDCTHLKNITIPESVASIGGGAFKNCTGLVSITIPESVASIGSEAFYGCTGLVNITIPESVTSINGYAFYWCRGLESITIPKTVTSIDAWAFCNCDKLKDVYYGGNLSQWSRITIGSLNGNLTNATVHCRIDDTAITDENKTLSWEYTAPGEYHYWLFSPSVSGKYIFESIQSGGDAAGYICDDGFNELYTDGTDVPKGDFEIEFDAQAGESYYLGARWHDPAVKGILPLNISRAYTISYDANGGYDAPEAQKKRHEEAINISSEVPTKEGHDFLGWSESADASSAEYAPGAEYKANSALALYAVWKIKTYTITYNANGGSGAPEAQTKTYGTELTLSSTVPEKEGYDFLGWSANAASEAGEYSAGASYSAEGDAVLYAVWKIKTYAVTYDANGGSGAPEQQTKTHGTNLMLSSTVPEREGYNFLGWSESADASSAEYDPGAEYLANNALALYAVWKIKTYAVTYDANGGSGAPEAQTKTHGTELTLSSTVPEKEGYDFLGWSANAASEAGKYSAGASYSAEGDAVLYAVWRIKTYAVTYDANGGSGAPEQQTKTHGTNLMLSSTVPEREGYNFLGWSESADASAAEYAPGAEYKVNSALALYAVWKIKTYTITYDANGGSVAPEAQTKTHGTELTLSSEVPTKEGYDFLGWSADASSAAGEYGAGASYSAEGDAVLYAVWKIKTYTISYDANGGSGAPEPQTKIYGTNLMLSSTVPGREGYNFLGWSESADASAAEYAPGAEYKANSDLALYAVWKIKTYTITYDANGGSGAPEQQTKTHGTELTLSSEVPTKEGYDFLGWSADASSEAGEYSTGASYSAEGDAVLYAVWRIKTYAVTYDANGGSGAPEPQTKIHGTNLMLSSTVPGREGYNFLGWSKGADASAAEYDPGAEYKANSALALYAVWKIKTYTVSYDANGGSGAPEAQIKTHGKSITLSADIPSRTGYDFIGWSKAADSQTAEYKSGASYSAEGNAVLYAVWRIKTYTVTYDANGGSGAPEPQTKIHGTNLMLSSKVPEREGYNFLGWSERADASAAKYAPGGEYKANNALMLYAVWRIKTYTISYDANGGKGAPGAQTKTHGERLTLSDVQPERGAGYMFVGWGISPTDKSASWMPQAQYNREGDITLYALWKCSPVYSGQPSGGYLMNDPANYEKIMLWPYDRSLHNDYSVPEAGDIYYTTDGSTPTRRSIRYDREKPPVISSPMTIKAAVFGTNSIDGDAAEFNYIRAEKPTLITLNEYATYVNIKYLRPEGAKSVSAEVLCGGYEVEDAKITVSDDLITVSDLSPQTEYHFRIKAEFYNGTLYSDEIIAKTTQYISDACDIISVRRPSGAVIDRDAKTVKGARVTNRYEETELDITVSRNASWELYETAIDAATRRNAVEDKTVKLEAGKTKTVFIRITAQDGLHDNIYSVEIYRQSKSAPPVFSRSSEYVLPGTELALSADGDLIKYTLDGSDPSEVNGIVYTSPLKLDNTVIVRAAAKEKDKDEYSDIITKKYTVGGFAILDAPSGLKWDGTSATWNAVPDAVSYLLTVYRDGVKLGDSIRVDGTNYDLKEKLSKSGKYTFEVTAQGDNAVYFNSDAELSAEYEFIEAEATPTPEPTQMPSPTPTPEPTQMPSPTPTPEPTQMPSPTPTPEPTQMPSPTPTPEPTQMPSPTPTPTPTAAPDLQKEIEYRIKGREITIFIPYRPENLHPYIAAYDKNNRLLSVKEAVISPDGEGVSIKTSFNNGDKILLWDGVKPISGPIIR